MKKGGVSDSVTSRSYTPCRAGSQKRGQITVFIIIGTLILFAFAGFLYLTKTVTTERVTTAGEPVIESVPQAFQPIRSYTENCLTQVAERGLLILGQQGGYISPELVGKYSTTDPADTDGVDLEPLKVPYWHYNKISNAQNEVSFTSLQPKLYAADDPVLSIEAQLSSFVEENLNECLDNYAGFEEQGFVIAAPALDEDAGESKEVITSVADQTVNFWLKMEVDAEKGEATHRLTQFYVKVPVRLKQHYEIASKIAASQTEHRFLERHALDLINTYSGVDLAKLPPIEAITFDAVPTAFWAESEVKNRVTGMLTSNIPMLRYLESRNFYRYEYAEEQGGVLGLHELFQKNYDNTIIPLENAENVDISFDYFGWDPYFDINDRGGQVEASRAGASYFLLQFHTNHYYSTYDLSYPVLVTLSDPDALLGKGFRLIFALEANIRNNQIIEEGYTQPPYLAAEEKSMVCDEDKRTTELIKTVVLDGATQEPLEAVQIGFSIPEQDDCILGETNLEGEFESRYPPVYGGVASFMKAEYLTNFYPIDTYEFRENPGIIGYAAAGSAQNVIELYPREKVNVTIKKKSLQKCITPEDESAICFGQSLFASTADPQYSYSPENLGETHTWHFVNTAQSLDEAETGTIVLTKKADLNPGAFSDEFTAAASISGTDKIEIQLVPGVYEVSGLLTDSRAVLIPEEERCTGGLFSTCYNFGQQNFDRLLTGQVQWDAASSYLTITAEQLYNADEITFYILNYNEHAVPAEEHRRIMEDLQVLGELGSLSQKLQASLLPNYK